MKYPDRYLLKLQVPCKESRVKKCTLGKGGSGSPRGLPSWDRPPARQPERQNRLVAFFISFISQYCLNHNHDTTNFSFSRTFQLRKKRPTSKRSHAAQVSDESIWIFPTNGSFSMFFSYKWIFMSHEPAQFSLFGFPFREARKSKKDLTLPSWEWEPGK